MYRRMKKKKRKLITAELIWEIAMKKHEGAKLKDLALKYKIDYFELSRMLKRPKFYIER